jgi:hypothetical protein
MNNWQMNQRRAAAALGLSTATSGDEHGKVRTLYCPRGGIAVLETVRLLSGKLWA